MSSQLEKVRELFLNDVDPETATDNELKIREWEQGLHDNQLLLDWQNHDITREIVRQAKDAYVSFAISLSTVRDLTEGSRQILWAKQDAVRFLISLCGRDAKQEIEQINKEITQALRFK